MRKLSFALMLLIAACGAFKGPKGDTGPAGPTGPMGAPGADGTDATVQPIQLCDVGYEATYPSHFPEYALCLQNELYGVYSANGGFLAKLPPGQYSSNGINSSCTFTIASDCIVIH